MGLNCVFSLGKVPQMFISDYVIITFYFVKNLSSLTAKFCLHRDLEAKGGESPPDEKEDEARSAFS